VGTATSPKRVLRSSSYRRARGRRLVAVSSVRRAVVPWSAVELSSLRPASGNIGRFSRPPAYVWLLIAAAALLHIAGFWYLHRTPPKTPKVKTELAMDLVKPPPPPPPKIDPPKPPPPIRHAQILPPIQEAAPVTNDVVAPSPEPPVAAAPVAAATPPPPPLPVVAPFGKAGYLNNPAPDYPAMAARQGWGGTVVLHVHVLANGKPDQVDIQTTSGHAPLDQEAVRAVKTWTFAPAKRGETAVDGWASVPIEFKL
jgi:periplasmic protein TonB